MLPSGCMGKETGDKILGIKKEEPQTPPIVQTEAKSENFYTKEARYFTSLGDKYKKEGDIEVAIEYYTKSIRTDPTYYQSYKELGLIYEKEYKEYDKAKDNYERSIALNPDDPELLYKLGNLYIHYDNYPKAIENFQKAIKLIPDYAEAYRNLGLAYSLSNKTDKAIENYLVAILLEPTDYKAYFNLGNAYTSKCPFDGGMENFFKEKNCKEAITAYETAIKLKPEYIKAYANLAHLYKQRGKIDKAKEYYEKALKVDPKNSIIKEHLESLTIKKPSKETTPKVTSKKNPVNKENLKKVN